ncbi:MAG: KpsF/GutQ family sugar-phosphate isomerase [Acidobacteria bacterium]|nr:KpsF/GutQ family sugar-phosphate isomerase [Acidobacteriota bacterium]MCB9398620.1 KpsF/GutQ family sugar-phosphate isomerase [Acidobacteriota bacterium]
MTLETARRVLQIEARAIQELALSLSDEFEQFVERIASSQGRVILTGMGKSGIICRKIAATLASTGTPAFFLHPAEAIHGDLGMIVAGDTVIAISNSGETPEILHLLEYIKRLGATLLAITAKPQSNLAQLADAAFCFHIDEEGCPIGLAPMASTTTTLAIGDALAAALMEKKGFTPQDFARFHPGGKLGKKVLLVCEVMHQGEQCPLVQGNTPLSEALIEMSGKRLGMTAVQLESGWGVLSDGDIRRILQKNGVEALKASAAELCTRNPKTIGPKQLAVEALNLMEQFHITALMVLDGNQYVGVVHLHDLWKTQLL